MPALLKDIFSTSFISKFSDELAMQLPEFNKQQFGKAVFDKGWKDRELKQRMHHVSSVLKKFLPDSFSEATDIICNLIEYYQKEGIKEKVIEYCFLPDYVEQYGVDDYEASVKTIEKLTQFTSCEFAVRPFLIRYQERMLRQMIKWSKHKHEKVRRLSSEGIRPRLPWAMALPVFKKNPEPLLPILENLKNDPSETVRRSVANNLNDISKDNPAFVISLFRKWKNSSAETDGIIKHGSRTLLKKGNRDVLKLFKQHESLMIELSGFKLLTPVVKTGDYLHFSFAIKTRHTKKQNIRLEYALYFLKANGQHTKKVFKISEKQLQPGETVQFQRKQSFKPITTRKYYPGKHKISIIANGKEFDAKVFVLD